MGILDLFKGFIIAIFVLLLVSAVPMLIFSNTIKSTVLQTSFYEKQFESAGIYVKAQGALLDVFSNMVDANTLSMLNATKAELRTAMSQSITKGWVKNETNRLARNILWYMTDQTQGVNLSVSIRLKITTGLANLVAPKFSISQSDAEQMITTTFTKDIPDPYDLSTLMPGVKNALTQAKSIVMTFMQISGILLFAIVVLLVLVFLFTLDVVKFSRIIGWPMLVTGIGLAVTSFLLPGMVTDMLKQSGIQASSGVSMGMIMELFQPIFSDILTQSIILAVISVLLIAFSFIYPMVTKGQNKKK